MTREVSQIEVRGEDAGSRLDRWVKRQFSHLTQGQIEKRIRKGEFRVDGARAKAAQKLETGQIIRIPPLPEAEDTPKPANAKPLSKAEKSFIRSLVIYEDDELYVLNKPSGLAVQGGSKTTRHIDRLLDGLNTGEDRPRLVHRLDRDTSGILVIAKHPASARELTKAFASRRVQKIYWAITMGVPHPLKGEIRGFMVKDSGPGDAKEKMRQASHGEEGAQFAITDYAVISQAGQRLAWVALKPLTGRTHQLRFHMHEMNTSILGDKKYRSEREVPEAVTQGLCLHARGLILPREGRADLVLQAPLSQHMQDNFMTLGFDESEAGKTLLEPFED